MDETDAMTIEKKRGFRPETANTAVPGKTEGLGRFGATVLKALTIIHLGLREIIARFELNVNKSNRESSGYAEIPVTFEFLKCYISCTQFISAHASSSAHMRMND
ncbi:hypothetical protein KQI65_08300 [bacterium]|nr:hypothetical protein [bacterium]